MYYMYEELDYLSPIQMKLELVKTNRYVLIIAQTAKYSNRNGSTDNSFKSSNFFRVLPVYNSVDNMWIISNCMWINSTTAPLYVSVCARAGRSFMHSVTLWIAAFRWRCWLCGLAKT